MHQCILQTRKYRWYSRLPINMFKLVLFDLYSLRIQSNPIRNDRLRVLYFIESSTGFWYSAYSTKRTNFTYDRLNSLTIIAVWQRGPRAARLKFPIFSTTTRHVHKRFYNVPNQETVLANSPAKSQPLVFLVAALESSDSEACIGHL